MREIRDKYKHGESSKSSLSSVGTTKISPHLWIMCTGMSVSNVNDDENLMLAWVVPHLHAGVGDSLHLCSL